ncbi:MAG: ribosome small subunit-dependent GTPase A [Clostridia bacterium]|nr:ribosome small subunit-dependent GTPase A [Clostridia bacterium]
MPRGIIVHNVSNIYTVKINKQIYICTAKGKFKNENINPVVGDNVEFDIINEEKKSGIITEILERDLYLKRPKVANITQIMLIISIKSPKPDLFMLDKQIAYAEFLKLKPIIIINKCDLDKKEEAVRIRNIYSNIGYEVIIAEAKNNIGIEKIKEKLKNNLTVFSGNSGVGKSTITNSLLCNIKTKEGEISQKNQRGKNTTTAVTIYEIEKNSYIVDTPGFSSFDISEIDYKDLKKYFIEFEKEECEFLDCSHTKERNCKIIDDVIKGIISKERYENYCSLYDNLKGEKLW